METLALYRRAVLTVITPAPTAGLGADSLNLSLITDSENDKYALIVTGWHNDKNFYGVMLHIEINNQKNCIIYANNTDRSIEDELEELGVAKQNIVSAY